MLGMQKQSFQILDIFGLRETLKVSLSNVDRFDDGT
jgi:hypothetical protein